MEAGGGVGDGERVAGVRVRLHRQTDRARLVGQRREARIEVELERGVSIVNVRLFATVTVTAVLFAASVTAGEVAVSIVAGAAVCVVTRVV